MRRHAFFVPPGRIKIERRSEFQLTQKRGASTIKVTKKRRRYSVEKEKMEIPHRRRRCHAAGHLSDGGRLRRDDHTHHRHGCPDFRHCHLVHGNPGELQFHDGYDCHDLHGEAAENRRIFYEAYKNVDTPFGSAWLAKFYTMRQKALVFGPDAKGEYLYFWLTKDGHVGYLGYSFIEDFIKKETHHTGVYRSMKMLQRTSQTI